jgi:hypothetical protein
MTEGAEDILNGLYNSAWQAHGVYDEWMRGYADAIRSMGLALGCDLRLVVRNTDMEIRSSLLIQVVNEESGW